MKLPLLFTLFLLLSFKLFAQDVTLSGKITDDAGNAVPFATVYIRSTTTGTSANNDGSYTLNLKAGSYDVQYRAIGFKPENRKINLQANQTLNITLKAGDYQIKEVTIHAGAEDPAYAIIRKAIKKRKTYLNEVNAYNCEVYIKGMQKLLDAPKKFLGVDVQKFAREHGLDSNRRGIIYLSESQSKYSFIRPDKVHEEIISSKFSGSNRAFTFNRASDMQVNFYQNLQNWEGLSNRPLISPIADNALSYYKYKYIGLAIENGETVNKIQVIPRNPHDPCFNGYIYIMEDSWRLQSLALYITKTANINFVDTLRVDEQFIPVDHNAWMPVSLKFDFAGGFFGFQFAGYFISIYKDYDIDPKFDKTKFAEVLRITKGVNKRDSTYWEQQRPIPLTEEERTDYKKKAVLAAKRESKPYLDSLDRINNRFSTGKFLLGGYHHRNRYEHEYFNVNSLLSSVAYNTIQGLSLGVGGSYSKQIDSLNNRYLVVSGKVSYGFSNKLFNASGGVTMPISSATLNLAAGSDVMDMNNREPISSLVNTAYTLFNRQNFEKLYQKQYASATLSKRIYGGWQASAGAEWANRKYLKNTTDYSVFHPEEHKFTSNNPLNPGVDVPLFPENQSFKVSLRTTYDFSNRYETYLTGKRYLPSKYPTIGIGFTKAIKNVFGSDADYNLLSADVSKTDIPMGFYGKTSFYIGAGKFFNTKSIFYTDYRHFAGNQVLFYQSGISKFLLLDYYQFSTGDKYLEGHLEHNFSGLFTNQIPLIRKLKLQEIIDVNYLSTPTLKNYTELGVGFQTNVGLRVMYGTSLNNKTGGANQAVRIGVSF
jgi:hypothetical protein